MKAYENTFERLFKEAGYLVLIYLVLIGSFFVFGFSVRAEAKSTRIKDIVDIEGVRDNMLIGYGLVVGLNGTGDSLSNSPFTQQSLTAMLERLGVNIRGENLKTDNVAAVMVTATLPAFANQGARIDVNVSAMGDSGSLQGGTLLVTPLKGADGEVYAVGQGTIITGGFSAQGDAGSVTRNIPTTGRVSEGAIIEREVDYDFEKQTSIRLALRNPDFTTARRISRAINGFIGTDLSHAENAASVKIMRPANYNGSIVDLITDIEQLPIQPDQLARIVIDENSGVIVIGSNVRINNVAIAQGSLTIKVTETPQVSQPSPFSETGETVVVPRTDIDVNRGDDVRLTELDTGVSLQDLVTGLNKLGVGPRDIITILQAIKAAGALQAEIQTM
jgi:flagellar P-ring protein precursor FlgI